MAKIIELIRFTKYTLWKLSQPGPPRNWNPEKKKKVDLKLVKLKPPKF